MDFLKTHARLFVALLRFGALAAVVGALCGAASALFLILLARVSGLRDSTPWLLYLLPVAGAAMGFVIERIGASAEGGNNLVLDEVIEFKGRVPRRMAPLVLLGTLGTHLFGGSAGREGTAVQMGASLSHAFSRLVPLSTEHRRILLMAGVAGGFGSVFGTPLAGCIFAMEVASVGKLRYEGFWPCLVASVVGDLACRALGVGHAHYEAHLAALNPLFLGKVLLASVAFAFAAGAFSELAHFFARQSKQRLGALWLRMLVGGCVVLLLVALTQTRDYLGLGLPLIERALFGPVGLHVFALKILFTTATVGFGFKGGEVTPLFAIGATLGAALAPHLGIDTNILAAIGFVAVFAAASNTPVASIVMGLELFGAGLAVPLAIACGAAWLLVGHRSIYSAQRFELTKGG